MTAAALTKELHHYPNAEKPLPPAAGSAPQPPGSLGMAGAARRRAPSWLPSAVP
ncbi:hypothetical protein H9L05_21350 (plasmid) [Hymenobacter qilianensis]|uniref:Uncharacterized protein n=1 Tax=Hymenobacter qilianensis TaxID=1385715 RepID=A0A7H0H112_9BACT|nr:hypothetical protein [Hymenobacter qilianensis]QNP54228.1 hypothetical protein H9L05_21350 [Hymenobacter qilianensis]